MLTSKLTVEELRKALLAEEQEETRSAVKSIMPQYSKEEETVCEQPRVCDNIKDVRVYTIVYIVVYENVLGKFDMYVCTCNPKHC